MYLGVQPDRLATIGEIAAAYRISENHLMKVVHALGVCGYIYTVRGKGGGIRLAKPPHDIKVGEVVRAIEDDWSLVECFEPARSECRIGPACALRGVLRQALKSFFSTLDRYTLADLIKPRERLTRILIRGQPASARKAGSAR